MNEMIQPDYRQLIFHFRGFGVMVDSGLAILYGISTKALKQQVKRNIKRFPSDFMFDFIKEKNELVTNCDRFRNLKHSSVNPIVFTEQGVAMLSSVLRSDKAIQINIEIMRTFARYRAFLRGNEEIFNKFQELDEKVNRLFQYLLERIDALHDKKNTPLPPVGYRLPER